MLPRARPLERGTRFYRPPTLSPVFRDPAKTGRRAHRISPRRRGLRLRGPRGRCGQQPPRRGFGPGTPPCDGVGAVFGRISVRNARARIWPAGHPTSPRRQGQGRRPGGTTAALEHPGDRRARGPRDTCLRAPEKRKCSRDPPDFFALISAPPFSPFFRPISARFPLKPPEIPKCRKKRRFGPSESPEKALRPPNLGSLGGDTAKNRAVSGPSRGPLENAGFAPLSWLCRRPSFDLLGKESFRRTHTLGAITWGATLTPGGRRGGDPELLSRFSMG